MSQLEPVEFRRVVAGRDHHPAVDAVVDPGEVKHRRNDRSDVDDVAATCSQPPHYGVADPGRTLPVVTADYHGDPGSWILDPGSKECNVGACNCLRDIWRRSRSTTPRMSYSRKIEG